MSDNKFDFGNTGFLKNNDGFYIFKRIFDCNDKSIATITTSSEKDTNAIYSLTFYNDNLVISNKILKKINYFKLVSLSKNNWLLLDGSYIYKTNDNGQNWENINSKNWEKNDLITFFEIYYSKQDSSIFIKKDSNIYKSLDLINLYKCKSQNFKNYINKIKVVDKNIAYAVGNDGLILKTTDGGGVFTDVEEDIKENQEVKITSFKNSSFSIELKYPPSQAKLELINVLGVPLFSQSTTSQLFNISLEPYPTGIYLLKYSDKHSTQVFKLLRE